MKKLILAYSGGLDTSYCVKYFTAEMGYEVHAVSVNTGGFTDQEIANNKEKALALGATSYTNIDAIATFYDTVVKYLIFGNVLKNNSYPLSVSAERIVQAIEIAKFAKAQNVDTIAHGSTGAGNDQVRFDMTFQTIVPELEIITPIRDQTLSRKQEIDYLQSHGISWSWEKAQYSINQGLWGTSVGGAQTLTSHQTLPEDAYPSQLEASDSQTLKIGFTQGEPISLNGKKGSPVEIIEQLEDIASKYAIGRGMHVGDTIIGIKGRVGFEAAASIIILEAHRTLEKHTLSKWQLQHKENIALWYGTHLHEGLYLEPVMRDFEAFLKSSQNTVTGEVELILHPYRFEVVGITSDYDLMQSKVASYGEENQGWTAAEAKGFIKILGNQSRIIANQNK
ncbi:argininosuccinate synthase [Dokdonia sp. Hel_I_63]|uniref:argininosuccinate synthase n=1 Tax=Dokdonia sp. Hel_I_63 TaxID=1249996 RepID=UPI001198E5FB|nr:argininosuccinate synthase [Dokdonia sp. Hel_I_63]TVZ23595.1 argininosuccinate synthase [Dokdonia sp. Hel_I_63]